jgi:hypothetical protein
MSKNKGNKNRNDLNKDNKRIKRGGPEPDKKAVYHPGSTTQGGSDFGQGSSYLGSKSYKQGSVANEGSTYEGERWVSDDVNDEPPPVGLA